MAKSRRKGLPHFRSLDKLVEFFDAHDLGEYWDEMPEAHFEVDIKRRVHLVAIDAKLADKLTQIARTMQTSSEELINSWLREKVLEQAQMSK